MSANKHYGRQIVLSLFLTVFGILGLLYLASRFLLPHIEVNQQQVYDVLVKLFPLLLGLIMIEVGVLVARRRDEEIEDDADRLPPNAYDRPFYTLPGDDPSHLHTEDLTYAQPLAQTSMAPQAVRQPVVQPAREPVQERVVAPVMEPVAPPVAAPSVVEEPAAVTEIQDIAPVAVQPEIQEPVAAPVIPPVTEAPVVEEPVVAKIKSIADVAVSPPANEPTIGGPMATPLAALAVAPAPVADAVVEEPMELINTKDFHAILAVELENALQMEYDLTLVIINVDEGPAEQIANKLMMLSADLAYSFVLDDGSTALVLPFYNNDEAKVLTLSMVESCQKEFAPATLKVGFASRAGRIIDAEQLIHEAEAMSERAD